MLNIIWSDDAVDDVLENIDYLENTGQKEWTHSHEEIDAVLEKDKYKTHKIGFYILLKN
jgi:plasmid stabilization system protein ParE